MEKEGADSLLFQIIQNERGFLLLTAMIFLFFITNLMMAASVAYESHYRTYDALKIAAIDQTKIVLSSVENESEKDNMDNSENLDEIE